MCSPCLPNPRDLLIIPAIHYLSKPALTKSGNDTTILFEMEKKKAGCIIPKRLSLGLLVLFAAPWLFGCLSVTPYNVGFSGLPESFDGFKIAVISDLHSHRFGKNQSKLLERIAEQAPDIVVLIGDIINKEDKDIKNIREFLAGICGVFPVYAIAGNHELENPAQFNRLLSAYREYGVVFLNGQTELLEREEHLIAISSQKITPGSGKIHWTEIDAEPLYKDEFNILLHHFGNEFDMISDEYDLVISGHVHGGIIRIFNKGLIGYDEKVLFFPKYSKGVYRKESGSVMVLSAGLGDASIPRINNPREIVIVTLEVVE